MSRNHDYEVLDAQILEAISTFHGIPNPFSLSKKGGGVLECSNNLIDSRFEQNTMLLQAAERKGLEYVQTAKIEDLAEEISAMKINVGKIPEKLRTAIYVRIDEQIRVEIQSFDGIPNAHNLSKKNGGPIQNSSFFINSRLKENPGLAQALEARALRYIEDVAIEELAEEVCTHKISIGNLSEKLQIAVHARIDKNILEVIRLFDGIPNANNLSKEKGGDLVYSNRFIKSRLKENPSLAEAAESRGLEYIRTAPIEELAEEVCTHKISISALSEKLQKALYVRIDEQILKAIQLFRGVPNGSNLSKEEGGALPYGEEFINRRLEETPVLWAAIAAKQGITVDQALELALERTDEQPAAVKTLLAEHLHDLYAFREMLAVIRIFPDVFANAGHVLEVSMYPAPLRQALALEEMTQTTTHVPMQLFRAHTIEGVQKTQAQVAVLQGLHRIDQESLRMLFREVHAMLPPGSHVIATYSREYMISDDFGACLVGHGFRMQEEGSGIIEIRSPEEDELRMLGVEDIQRATRKLTGESNVLHFITGKRTSDDPIPELIKLARPPSGREIPIITPQEFGLEPHIVKEVDIVLIQLTRNHYPSAPFIITVLEEGTRLAVIGYDMHPVRKRVVEVGLERQARDLAGNFRSVAQELVRNVEMRNNLGVIPGKEITVQKRQLRHL